MTTREDPFERAARREHLGAKVRREIKEESGPFRIFGFPYLIWAGIRALKYDWSAYPQATPSTSSFLGLLGS